MFWYSAWYPAVFPGQPVFPGIYILISDWRIQDLIVLSPRDNGNDYIYRRRAVQTKTIGRWLRDLTDVTRQWTEMERLKWTNKSQSFSHAGQSRRCSEQLCRRPMVYTMYNVYTYTAECHELSADEYRTGWIMDQLPSYVLNTRTSPGWARSIIEWENYYSCVMFQVEQFIDARFFFCAYWKCVYIVYAGIVLKLYNNFGLAMHRILFIDNK